MVTPNFEASFGGKRLVFGYRSLGILFAHHSITVDDLVMVYNGQLRFWNQQTARLYGNITLKN